MEYSVEFGVVATANGVGVVTDEVLVGLLAGSGGVEGVSECGDDDAVALKVGGGIAGTGKFDVALDVILAGDGFGSVANGLGAGFDVGAGGVDEFGFGNIVGADDKGGGAGDVTG